MHGKEGNEKKHMIPPCDNVQGSFPLNKTLNFFLKLEFNLIEKSQKYAKLIPITHKH
jgi:hypothetical protein